MTKNIEDYRNYIKSKQESLKNSLGPQYQMKNMAEFCAIQKTYLSKVMHLGAHLTEDQVFRAGQFLKLDEEEFEYLQLIHAYTRSDYKDRKDQLKKKIIKIQTQTLKSEKKLSIKKIEPDNNSLMQYYLVPYTQLVHIFLTIERFRKDVTKIAQVLNLSKETLQNILDLLLDLGIIQHQHGQIILQEAHFFLPSEHPLAQTCTTLAKQLAIPKVHSLPQQDKSSFSIVLSCSEETWKEIRQKVQQFLSQTQKKTVKDSNPEGVYQLSLDFFPWYTP